MYDETRRVLNHETLNGIKEMLTKYGCHSILEIGVGTGRIAIPLIKDGYDVIGADISRRMMEKARAKGMRNLFLTEGSRVPFREMSFDATFMAHVFHLLDNPISVMTEAARVSRVGVFALLRKRASDRWSWFYDDNHILNDEVTRKFLDERRERFRKIAKKYAWSLDPSHRLRNWRREQEILETYPPDDVKVMSDVVVNDSIEERIARFEKGGYSLRFTHARRNAKRNHRGNAHFIGSRSRHDPAKTRSVSASRFGPRKGCFLEYERRVRLSRLRCRYRSNVLRS